MTPTRNVRAASEAWESLFRTQVTLMRIFDRHEIWSPASQQEYDVLFSLSRAPRHTLRLKELEQRLLIHQSSVSRMVERLESRGWVRRLPSVTDGRGTDVALTEEGTAVQRTIGARHARDIVKQFNGALTDKELATLTDLTTRLRESVRANNSKGKK